MKLQIKILYPGPQKGINNVLIKTSLWIPDDANALRAAIVDCILSKCPNTDQLNFHRIKDTIAFNLREQLPMLSKYGENEESDRKIIQTYGDYMSKPGNYGTSSELCIAAELFGFVGFVLQQDDSGLITCFEFGSTSNAEEDKKKPKLFLLFTGSIDGGHFRYLKPITPKIPKTIELGGYTIISNESMNKKYKSTTVLINVRNNDDEQEELNINANEKTEKFDESKVEKENIQPVTYECNVCKKHFPTKKGMNIHRSRHAKEANTTTTEKIISKLNPISKDESNNKESNEKLNATIEADCKQWQNTFHMHENNDKLNEESFEKDIDLFLEFLFKVNEHLPGPQHPAVKFYRLRKKKKMNMTSAQQS